MAGLKLPYNPRRKLKEDNLGVTFGLRPVNYQSKRHRCPFGQLPGTCLNGQCPSRMIGHDIRDVNCNIEEEAAQRHKQHVNAIEKDKKARTEAFFEEEKRLMGIQESGMNQEGKNYDKPSPAYLEYLARKEPVKTMRMPARPLCMLEAPDYTAPKGDYAELSRFLRLSTMPGHSDNDHVSEYNGSHNMGVWDGQKDLNRQAFKMKRDWLSVWGEFNVKEQRWRKAWVEKFGADKV